MPNFLENQSENTDFYEYFIDYTDCFERARFFCEKCGVDFFPKTTIGKILPGKSPVIPPNSTDKQHGGMEKAARRGRLNGLDRLPPLLHRQDLDGNVGVAVTLGDVLGIGIGEGHGIAHLHALAALQGGVGHEQHIGLPLLGGGVVVAVALEDTDAAGPAVDEFHQTLHCGAVIIQSGQRGYIPFHTLKHCVFHQHKVLKKNGMVHQ